MKKKTILLMLAAVVMFLVQIVAIAGDLELSTAPTPTMHTLDDIYNKTSAQNLPDPDTVTIVTKFKRSIDTTTWQPLHTVAQGKTFYLMGATCLTYDSNNDNSACDISFNGGGSTDFNLPACNTIAASYPIAGISSRSDIMVKNTDYSADMYCTIFGYEK